MAKSGSLRNDGLTLALLGAILAFILLALGFVGQGGSVIDFSLLDSFTRTGSTLGIALTLLFIFILYFIAIQRINIGELVIEGILVLLLGLLIGGIGGLFAAFGGVLIILEAIF